MKKGILLVVVGVVTVSAVLLFSCIEVIPPHDLTNNRVFLTEQRIRLFWEKNGRLPPDLSNLPLLPDRYNDTKDGWGRQLEYKVEGNKITLWSTGKTDAVSLRDRGVTNMFDVTKPLDSNTTRQP